MQTDNFAAVLEENTLSLNSDMGHSFHNLQKYAQSRFFGQPKTFYCESPFYRPVRPQDIDICLLGNPLSDAELAHPNYLMAQRLLLNIYEQDLVFLPNAAKQFKMADLKEFYAPELVAQGRSVRPPLEKFAFDWLEKKVHVGGAWKLDAFTFYTNQVLSDIEGSDSTLYKKLTGSADPRRAAQFFLIQCAGDFLAEASAMGRNVLGNFGPHTSELFKIFIDEYGYGVHEKKHSTIFEQMMKQAGLSADIHYYWQFYTASSIALINYFHYVSANHGSFFRYIGALYYTEASLAFTTKAQSQAIRDIFNGEVSTRYFDEHTHIDVHHGRMALEKLIIPMVEQYGEAILPEILRGFEEFRVLQSVADDDLYAHIAWHDQLDQLKQEAAGLKARSVPDMFFTEPMGELSVTHCHPVDELFCVEEGQVEFIASPMQSIVLSAGDGIVIRAGMLHGSKVLSDQCKYSVSGV
jgi:hypothetical protein